MCSKYAPFHTALEAGVAKVEEYYEKITDNQAYIISMREFLLLFSAFFSYSLSLVVLNTEEKTNHFKKHWNKDLQNKVRVVAEDVVSFLQFIMWYCSIEWIVVVQGAMV